MILTEIVYSHFYNLDYIKSSLYKVATFSQFLSVSISLSETVSNKKAKD